jgi:MbtH protein
MAEPDEDTGIAYLVVLNDEEQYSLWPVSATVPAGWRAEGTTGSEKACLDRIDVVWTDMRPLGLRRWMDGGER